MPPGPRAVRESCNALLSFRRKQTKANFASASASPTPTPTPTPIALVSDAPESTDVPLTLKPGLEIALALAAFPSRTADPVAPGEANNVDDCVVTDDVVVAVEVEAGVTLK